jgi:hypothetical protein
MHRSVSLFFVVSCIDPGPVAERPPLQRQADTSPLGMEGGTLRLGADGQLTVSDAPALATIDLYVGRDGEGLPDCVTFAPTCVDLVNGELYATATASNKGVASFVLDADDFLETGEVAWQAVATHPVNGAIVAGFPIVRHVVVPLADADLALVPVTDEVGIGPLLTDGNTHTGGVAWVDYNDDLWTDLLVVNGGGLQNALFRNDGDGTFTWIEGLFDKPDLLLEPAAAKYADIDDDKDIDVVMAVDNPTRMQASVPQPYEGGPNLVYVNQGDGTFLESAAATGLVDPRGWRNSDLAFADYDRDGCIDVALGNWAMATLPAGDNFSRLMQGNCDGTFVEVTATTGTDGSGRDTLVTFWWDANADLYPDLYMGNASNELDLPDYDPTANFYYNDAGVDFEDQVPALQPYLALDAWAPMGADVGDIDLDGDWDLYLTDSFELGTAPNGNPLYLGNADGTLTANVCSEHDACGGYNAWPANFADFNRDTFPDLWIGGYGDDGEDLSLVYINKGDGRFEHHEQADFGGGVSRGGSIADYDGDGDIDVFLWVEDGASKLYRNDPIDTNHWLEVRLYGGRDSSWDAIGATVYATVGGVRQMRRVSGGDSAHSQTEPILHFGLGDADVVETLEVEWPSGKLQTFLDVPADDLVRIHEAKGFLRERLLDATAVYDTANQTLTVSCGSTFGGRTTVNVIGFGDLQYDAASVQHAAVFTGIAVGPAKVLLESARGANTKVTVTII